MLLTIITLTSLAVLVRIFANPLSNVFQKQLTQRATDPLFVISATYGFLALVCLVFWPQLRVLGLCDEFWLSMLVASVLAMFGNVFLVKALHVGDLSVLGPINAYKSVVGLIMGVFVLHEIPGLWGLLGVLLIISGSYIVLADRQQRKGFSWQIFERPEVRLRLAALVFSAIDGVFLKKAILLSTPVIAFFLLVSAGLWLYANLDYANHAKAVAAADGTSGRSTDHFYSAMYVRWAYPGGE
ncbi:EamA family transporter [Spirosoma aerolatum]|uniref:EamA family transporter n=1 Tax=Spirosoma aerolatum TaxID=1211326 RepID=UPI001FE4E2D8|nr:EamA family transporter [Spirosoma aerolatum]